MKNLLFRAYPVFAVLTEMLLLYELGKDFVSDIKEYCTRKKTSPAIDNAQAAAESES